jgi:uncharacterized protein YwgA
MKKIPPPPAYASIITNNSESITNLGISNTNNYEGNATNNVIITTNNSNSNTDILNQQLEELFNQYEINDEYAQKLKVLKDFKIVFILDDSGSMTRKLIESPLNKKDNSYQVSRWDELQYFTSLIIEIAIIFNPFGCDVYFLNRKNQSNVIDKEQLSKSFIDRPKGFTPLESRLKQVLNDNPDRSKKLLIMIVTDGEPTDLNGKVNVKQFKDCLLSRPDNVYTTIAACTDDDESVEYLNNWDRDVPRLDIVDDYRSEKAQIKQTKGKDYSFTFGDYIVKSLIGSIDSDLNQLDGN